VQHPSVLEAAVIGAPDVDGLIKSKAFVVLKEGASADEAELKNFVKDRLAPYKYPRSIAFLAELPKTATGKIQRFRLREQEQNTSAMRRAVLFQLCESRDNKPVARPGLASAG
jgi:benzoate-CoA ligase